MRVDQNNPTESNFSHGRSKESYRKMMKPDSSKPAVGVVAKTNRLFSLVTGFLLSTFFTLSAFANPQGGNVPQGAPPSLTRARLRRSINPVTKPLSIGIPSTSIKTKEPYSINPHPARSPSIALMLRMVLRQF